MNKTAFIVLLTVLIIQNSCLQRQFIKGRSEIISVSDTALNDSSFVCGHIHRLDRSQEAFFDNEFLVWIENTDLKTTNDTTGYYFLKTKPGNFTIKCKSSSNEWERLLEEINVELQKNKKTEIDFYIGYTVE